MDCVVVPVVATSKLSLTERLARIFIVRIASMAVGVDADLFEVMRLTTAKAGYARTQNNGFCMVIATIVNLIVGAYELVENSDSFAVAVFFRDGIN